MILLFFAFLENGTELLDAEFTDCSSFNGGAVLIESFDVSLLRCRFARNKASIGGCLLVISPSHCNVSQCTFKESSAHVVCAGFLLDSAKTKTKGFTVGCNFSLLRAPSAASLDLWDGNQVVKHCTMSVNRATHSYGSVRVSSKSPNICEFFSCVFSNNSCCSNGGATFAFWHRSALRFKAAVFIKNSAKDGRGNSVFIGNTHIECALVECVFDGSRENEVYVDESKSHVLVERTRFLVTL